MPFDTFVCSTALPVLDSGSHYPGWFDTTSESHLYPFGRLWMKGLFVGYSMDVWAVAGYKATHGGYMSQF